MASIAFDGQSFSIDGKRVFLVGGTIHYARLPRATWADRIIAARSLGLNTITVPVVWARHESRPNQFDFSGENDLRHFVQLIGEAGMMACLRIGPFIDSGYDLGGLPAWLTLQKDIALRANSGVFLESCSRFFSAVANQVRDLQVSRRPSKVPTGASGQTGQTPASATTEPNAGGPILLVQSECDWTCGVDEMAAGYLGELNRYLRESGFEVPIINANQLWQAAEAEVDTWTTRERLIQDLRQLAQVRQNQPRLLSQYRVTETAAFGDEDLSRAVSPETLTRDLAEVLACGAQFNIEPICSGLSMGFAGGRLPIGQDDYLVPHTDAAAPIDLLGRPGPLASSLRRISMFASNFARVLAHLDVRRPPVALLPSSVIGPVGGKGAEKGAEKTGDSTSVVHLHGAQGGVVFLFRKHQDVKDSKANRSSDRHGDRPLDLLLPDGSTLRVHPGDEQVMWLLLDARLAGRATLDFSNLMPLATVGRVLVLYGTPGSTGIVSINGSTVEFDVPGDGQEPMLMEHEGVILVVTTRSGVDSLQVVEDGVYLNCSAVSMNGEPIVAKADHVITRIADHGEMTELKYDPKPKVVAAATPAPVVEEPVKAKGKKAAKPKPEPKPKKGKYVPPPPPPPPVLRTVNVQFKPSIRPGPVPALGEWAVATTAEHCAGTSARYASISGPSDLAQMGAAYGYGWYRITLKNSGAHKARIAWPTGGDRLHLFTGGESSGVLGYGPGASDHGVLNLKKGEQQVIVLAETLGRFAGTTHMLQQRGCAGPLLEVASLKVARPTLHLGDPVEAGVIKGLLLGLHKSHTTEPHRVRFTFPHKKKTTVVVRIKPTSQRAIILLDNAPLKVLDSSGPAWITLTDDQLGKGNHQLEFAIFGNPDVALKELADAISFEEVQAEVTAGAQWGFAKWELPPADSFSVKHKAAKGLPVWLRSSFAVAAQQHAPLILDLSGLSKGQLYLNGKHLCRYFVSTAEGKPVGPQHTVLLPDPMLHHGGSNEVTIFDEHGFGAAKVKLLHA